MGCCGSTEVSNVQDGAVSDLWGFCLALKCPVFILSILFVSLTEQTRLEAAGGAKLHGHPMAHHIHLVLHWNGKFFPSGSLTALALFKKGKKKTF